MATSLGGPAACGLGQPQELHFVEGAQSKGSCTCFSGSRHGIKAILALSMVVDRGPVILVLFSWAGTNPVVAGKNEATLDIARNH